MRMFFWRTLVCALFFIIAASPHARGGGEPPQSAIPTPESVLGYTVGSDFELANYEQSLEYFQQLAAASDRVELRRIGETSFGRPWYLALISSAENLRDPKRYRETAPRLPAPTALGLALCRGLLMVPGPGSN